MSEFELITLTFSFVLGLGVAQILSAASSALRNRNEVPLHWIPLTHAGIILLLHIQYWFALFEFDTTISEWTWTSYGPLLLLAVLIYLSGGVVLPAPGSALSEEGLRADFNDRGKVSLLLLAAYATLWIPVNAFMNGDWLILPNLINVVFSTLLMMVYFARSERARGTATVGIVLLVTYAILFVWSTPADVS